MKIDYIFKSSNYYIDTYYLYNPTIGYFGIMEKHLRGVKQPYYVAWAVNPDSNKVFEFVETFDTEKDAENFIINHVDKITY